MSILLRSVDMGMFVGMPERIVSCELDDKL